MSDRGKLTERGVLKFLDESEVGCFQRHLEKHSRPNDGEIVCEISASKSSDDEILVELSEPQEWISEQCIFKDKEEI